MKEYIKPNIKSCEVSGDSLLASLSAFNVRPTSEHLHENENQFSKKHGTTSLWDYDDEEEEEENN